MVSDSLAGLHRTGLPVCVGIFKAQHFFHGKEYKQFKDSVNEKLDLPGVTLIGLDEQACHRFSTSTPDLVIRSRGKTWLSRTDYDYIARYNNSGSLDLADFGKGKFAVNCEGHIRCYSLPPGRLRDSIVQFSIIAK